MPMRTNEVNRILGKIDEVAKTRKIMENSTHIVTDNSKVNAKLIESNRELLEALEKSGFKNNDALHIDVKWEIQQTIKNAK